MQNTFYAYMLVNPFSGVPFYVGKGSGSRAYYHMAEAMKPPVRGSNRHKSNTIRQIVKQGGEVKVVFLDSDISEDQAFECEEFAISFIGRADLGNGPLTNLTDGGDGLSGVVRDLTGENNPNFGRRGEQAIWWGRKHDEATKQKIADKQKGREFAEEHKAKMRKPKSEAGRAAIAQARKDSAYRPTEETKKKVSFALKGRPSPMLGRSHSQETRDKLSASRKGLPSKRKGRSFALSDEAKQSLRNAIADRNAKVIECPHCGKSGKYVAMIRWHMDNCKLKGEQ